MLRLIHIGIKVYASGIIIEVGLLLGLHLIYTLHVVLVDQEVASPPQSVHSGLDADCFQLGTVKIVGGSS
jgi:hypothetical protein